MRSSAASGSRSRRWAPTDRDAAEERERRSRGAPERDDGLHPVSGSEVPGITRKAAVGSVTFFYLFVSGSTVYSNNIGASAPFAWASGTLHANFSYQV